VAPEVPVVNVGPLLARAGDTGVGLPAGATEAVARAIDSACRESGFFYVVGHGIDPALRADLDSLARGFFFLPEAEKRKIEMARAGRAWRGWFPVGAELTSGVPDLKEGIYFGSELGTDDPRVRARTPMHGPNLFPSEPADLEPTVLAYLEAMTQLGQVLLRGISLALGLEESWFGDHLTSDPLVLFRIFRYPAIAAADDQLWSVGEHTDYGLLTLLAQDDSGGLQVHTPQGWIDVPPVPDTFVCNLGDMLERLTGGLYRSTPHRVRNPGSSDRLSFPFFLDPSWDAVVNRLPIVDRPPDPASEAARRWDHASVHGFEGTYGDYILTKVGKVFPDLARLT
jgi:isopenicillin N synthase-like dioxygenase